MAYTATDFFGKDGLSSLALLRPDARVTPADRDASDSSPSFEDSGLSSGGSPESSALLSGTSRRRRRRRKPRLTGLSKQRQAANERERVRMQNLTAALGVLREHIPPPVAPKDKRLSKIETLKLAIGYIDYLGRVLEESAENAASLLPPSLDSLDKEDAKFDIVGHFKGSQGQDKERKCRKRDRNGKHHLNASNRSSKKIQRVSTEPIPTATKVQPRPSAGSRRPDLGSHTEVPVKMET